MSKKAVDLTISTIPNSQTMKKVENDLAEQEEKRRKRLEEQKAAREAAQERDRLEREKVEREVAEKRRAKQASQSRSEAARRLSWNRGRQGERQTDEGYTYSYNPAEAEPPKYENVGQYTSASPATKEELREAEKISLREYFYSKEDVPEKGSPRERWFSFTPEERSLAKKMAFDGYDENDAQMRAFAEKMGNGYAPEGVGVIGEAYQSELDSDAGKAVLALESEYERQDNAENDAAVAAGDREKLEGFTQDELAILFGSIGRVDPIDMSVAYDALGAKDAKSRSELQDAILKRAGGNQGAKELWETYSIDLNAKNAEDFAELGKKISEWNGTAGFVFARAGDLLSATGSIPEGIYNLIPAMNGRTGRYSTADPNAGLAALRAGIASADETTKQQILDALAEQFPDNQLLQTVLQTAAGYGYNAVSQATNNILRNFLLGPLGLAMMGADSFNRSYNEAAAMGIDPRRATAVSTLKALGEVGTELIPFDSARKSFAGKSTWKSVAIGFFGEVIGEELSELIGDAAEDHIYVDDSQYNDEIKKRVLGGMKYEDAKAEVDAQYQQKYIDILIETALSSAVSEGTQYFAGKVMHGGENQEQAQEQQTQQQEQQNPVDAIVNGTVQDIVGPEQKQEQAAEPAAPVRDSTLEQAVQETLGVQEEAEIAEAPMTEEERQDVETALESPAIAKAIDSAMETGNVSNSQAKEIAKDASALSTLEKIVGETLNRANGIQGIRNWVESAINEVVSRINTDTAPVQQESAEVQMESADSAQPIENITGQEADTGENADAKPVMENPAVKESPSVDTAVEKTVEDVQNQKAQTVSEETKAEPVAQNSNQNPVQRNAWLDNQIDFLGEDDAPDGYEIKNEAMADEGVENALKSAYSGDLNTEEDYVAAYEAYRDSLKQTDNGTSVGAASSGFTNDADYNRLGQEYGTQPPRKNDAVPTNVPKKDKDGRTVSQNASNVYGSPITNDNVLPELRRLIQDGVYSYDKQSNRATTERAFSEMEGKSVNEVLAGLESIGESGLSGAVPVAKAQLLYEWVMDKMDKDAPMSDNDKQIFARIISAKRMLSVNSGRALQQFSDDRKMHPDVAKLVFKADTENVYRMAAKMEGYLDDSQRAEIAELKQNLKDAKTAAEKRDIKDQIKAVKNRGAHIEVPANLLDSMQAAYKKLNDADTEVKRQEAKNEIAGIYDAVGKIANAELKATAETKWRAYRYLSMLGSPVTQLRNFAGNGGVMPYSYYSRQLAGLMNQILRAQDSNTTAFLNRFSEADRALIDFGKNDALTNQDVKDYMQYSGKFAQTATVQRVSDKLDVFDNKALEGWRRLTNKATKGGDIFYKNRYYPQYLAQWLKGHNITAQMLENGEVDADTINKGRLFALNQAERMTFNDSNRFSEWVASIGRNMDKHNVFSNLAYMVMEGRAPFRATPANIGIRAVEASPFGIGKGIIECAWAKMNDVHDGKITVSKGLNDIAEGFTGTALIGLGYMLASGLGGIKLHGNNVPPEDEKDGIQKFSVEFSVNGKRYTEKLSNLGGPSLYAMVAGATLYENMEQNGGALDIGTILDFGIDLFDPLFDTSMLSGIRDMARSFVNNEATPEQFYDLFVTSVGSMLSQNIPSTLKQVYNAFFSSKRRTYNNTESGAAKPILNTLAGIPGIGDAMGLRMDKLDEYGKPIPALPEGINNLGSRLLNNLLNPGALTQIQEDPLRAEVKRLNATGISDETISIDAGTNKNGALIKSGVGIDENGHWDKNTKYTKAQWEAMAKTQGAENQKIRDYIASDEYQDMSDDEKVKRLKDLDDRASDTAKQEFIWNTIMDLQGSAKTRANATLMEKDGELEKMQYAMQSGVDFWDFRAVASGYADRDGDKNAQIMYGILDSGASESAIDKMLPAYLDDSPRERLAEAKKYGVSSSDFVKAYDAFNKKDNETGLTESSEKKLIAYFGKKSYGTNKKGQKQYFTEAMSKKLINLMNAGFTENQAIAMWLILDNRDANGKKKE